MVSHGLVVRNEVVARHLLSRDWEMVVVDEAHRARRRKLPRLDESGTAIRNPESEANKLYAFLYRLAPRTRSMLLSTATPVQMHPIEAWDLLRLLSEGNDHIKEYADYLISIPDAPELLQPMLTVIPLQLLAYFVAREFKEDIDQPRNLAKSVTVE